MINLLADIGGTNTRCAIVVKDDAPRMIEAFENRRFTGLPELLHHYIESLPADSRPASATFAIAAPIRADTVRMINIDWEFSTESLRRSLKMDRLKMLNDFEALAIGLPNLEPGNLMQIGGGERIPD